MKLVKLLWLCAIILSAACSQIDVTEQAINTAAKRELTISLEEGDTRVQLANGKTVWTEGDQIAVFYGTAGTEKWAYNGETGSRIGTFYVVTPNSRFNNMSITAIAYPYQSGYRLDALGKSFKFAMPATQTYLKDSYGLDGNILVGRGNEKTATLRNVCGWVRLNIKGNGEIVRSIKLRGNNNEQVAGEISVNLDDATSTLTTTAANALTEVTLNCSNGVKLSSEATAFYIALPPQTFTNGFTIEITCNNDLVMTKETSKSVTISRNTITPMAAFEFEVADETYPAKNQIWYATTDGSMIDIPAGTFDAEVEKQEFGVCFDGTCYSYYCVTFKSEITEAKAQALVKNSTIETLYLPHSITTISDNAFYGCSNLKTLYLGKHLSNLKTGAFTNCGKLSSIYCRATTPPSRGDYVFMFDGSTGYTAYVGALIYVPTSAVSAYKSHDRWRSWSDYIRSYDFGDETNSGEGGAEGGSGSMFNHRILLVDHTGVNCGYCPMMTDRLYALAHYSDPDYDFSSYYHEVQCHGSEYAGTSDPAYSSAAATVDSYYKNRGTISGYPTLAINFRNGKVSRGSTDSDFVENAMNYIFKTYHKPFGADAGIYVTNSVSDKNIDIDIEVTAAVSNEYKVTAWVLENNIYSPNQYGASTERHKTYHHCLRAIAGAYSSSDISGDSLGTIEAGESASKSFSVSLDSSWVTANLEVLVIVSAPDSSGNYEVVNTALCPINGTQDYEYLQY